MNAIYAGLTAWLIELTVVGIILYALHIEEQKIYRKRNEEKKHENG
jgi:hypothetical protein